MVREQWVTVELLSYAQHLVALNLGGQFLGHRAAW